MIWVFKTRYKHYVTPMFEILRPKFFIDIILSVAGVGFCPIQEYYLKPHLKVGLLKKHVSCFEYFFKIFELTQAKMIIFGVVTVMFRGYTFTQELEPKGTTKNSLFSHRNYIMGTNLPTCICLFSHRNYQIVTGY